MAAARPPSNPHENTNAYAAGRDNSRATDDRFTGDQFLREWGFAIASRPADGPAIWKRISDGRTYTDREARASAMLARARAMKGLEEKK